MSETPEQMHNRLKAVMAAARFEPLPQPYAWQRVDTLVKLPSGALASVRDGSTWYALAPASPEAAGVYRILVFHFAEGTNASGFVAWLAGLMKTEVGTGAMVVCGFDARATPALWQTSLGLFDYWGCPWACGEDVIALVERLRREEPNEQRPRPLLAHRDDFCDAPISVALGGTADMNGPASSGNPVEFDPCRHAKMLVEIGGLR